MKFNLEGKTFLSLHVADTATEEEKIKEFNWDEAGLPWTTLLDSFVGFLSDFYGYDIHSQVAIRRNPCRVSSTWRGKYWGQATDEEIELHQALEDFDETDFKNYGGTDSDD